MIIMYAMLENYDPQQRKSDNEIIWEMRKKQGEN